MLASGAMLLLLLGGAVLFFIGQVDRAGGAAQRAADLSALAAGQALARNPDAGESRLDDVAASVARANGARLESITVRHDNGVPSGVEVAVTVVATGDVPSAGAQRRPVTAQAFAAVEFTASPDAASFRPVDLHGLTGRAGVVEAAAAQVGWPYVWGGESRAEGGFDCSGLVDYAYAAAGAPLPGRPTAVVLWSLAQHIPEASLLPADLVFMGSGSGAPYHVGIYAGDGEVLVAPHTGAQVRWEPLAGGGWDGFGRLVQGPAPLPSAVDRAAHAAGVAPYVVNAELRLGLAADPTTAASGLAAAERDHPGDLQAALAQQLGSASAAALVLRIGSGPALTSFRADVRLAPLPASSSRSGSGSLPAPPVILPRGPAASVTAQSALGTGLQAGEEAAVRLAARGRGVPLQAFAALRTAARLGVTFAGLVLPGTWQAAAAVTGSVWDALSAVRDLVEVAGEGGLVVAGMGVWALRLNLIGGVISTVGFAVQAVMARSRRDRIADAALAVGSGLTTVGVATAGTSLIGLGGATLEVPPVGLALIAVGSLLCAGAYLYQNPQLCRRLVNAGSRALDLAWRVQTTPVRAAVSVASDAASKARSLVESLPTPW